ncbi:MAG: hypothetical protein LBO69_09965 [Ignavibacteria bacterium]|jgi:hypothetical protein|nr:hypothetical protein [Ignavibacteria bacterium]
MEDIDLLEDEVVEQEFVINEKGERLAYVSPEAIASIEQGLAEKRMGLGIPRKDVDNYFINKYSR